MKILVTGLCMQGNKGGPALALSLKSCLEPLLPRAKFVFSVPGGLNFHREKHWAQRFGVEVIEDFYPRDFVDPRPLLRLSGTPRAVRWVQTLHSSDLLLEMSAISYVGPPASRANPLLRPRPRYFALAKLFGRPFLAWTQSYGPFSTPLLRRLARADLSSLPVVFCRGEETARAVQTLLPQALTEVYPDVAITLPFSRKEGAAYLKDHHSRLDPQKLVTLSASTVVEARGAEGLPAHSQLLADFAVVLSQRGYSVLLVPHSYYPDSGDPKKCDHALSRLICEKVPPNLPVEMVTPDLSPSELKALISQASIHVGGRYHSVIAALSSEVPCISLSWHHKYRDIMDMYGVGSYVLEADSSSLPGLLELFSDLEERRDAVSKLLAAAQQQLTVEVKKNAERLVELLS